MQEALWLIVALLAIVGLLLWRCLHQLHWLNIRAQDLVENSCKVIDLMQR